MRVVVAEDSVLLREGLVRLIEDEGALVVAAVGDGPALVAAVTEHRPDVSVVDVRMPPTQRDKGLRASIETRLLVPRSPMFVLRQYVEVQYASELLADGAGGVIEPQVRFIGGRHAKGGEQPQGQTPGRECSFIAEPRCSTNHDRVDPTQGKQVQPAQPRGVLEDNR